VAITTKGTTASKGRKKADSDSQDGRRAGHRGAGAAPGGRRSRRGGPCGLMVDPNHVARRAFVLFLERGAKHGHDVEDWLRAEREVLAEAAAADRSAAPPNGRTAGGTPQRAATTVAPSRPR
jgi:hypothetical protein